MLEQWIALIQLAALFITILVIEEILAWMAFNTGDEKAERTYLIIMNSLVILLLIVKLISG